MQGCSKGWFAQHMLNVDRWVRHELQTTTRLFVEEFSFSTTGLGRLIGPEECVAELARCLVLEGANGDRPHSCLKMWLMKRKSNTTILSL